MNKILFILTMAFNLSAVAQEANEKDVVLKTVQQFFTALENQDTVLFNAILFADGQSGGVRQENDSVKWSWQHFDKAVNRWVNPKKVIHEKPLPGVEIKIHQQLATAWVPYELFINDKFSHCGIDIFTLAKTMDGWKIVTLIYTIEPKGCEALKKN